MLLLTSSYHALDLSLGNDASALSPPLQLYYPPIYYDHPCFFIFQYKILVVIILPQNFKKLKYFLVYNLWYQKFIKLSLRMNANNYSCRDIETGIDFHEDYAWVDALLESRYSEESLCQMYNFYSQDHEFDDDEEPFPFLQVNECDTHRDHIAISIDTDETMDGSDVIINNSNFEDYYSTLASIYRTNRIRNDDVSNYFYF